MVKSFDLDPSGRFALGGAAEANGLAARLAGPIVGARCTPSPSPACRVSMTWWSS